MDTQCILSRLAAHYIPTYLIVLTLNCMLVCPSEAVKSDYNIVGVDEAE
jgi:hypothetical protein